MKKSRFTEEQIIKSIKRQEAGEKTEAVCRDIGISAATFYKGKEKFGGMEVSEAKKLRSLEEENRRLKSLVAELSLDKQALQWIVEKSCDTFCKKRPGARCSSAFCIEPAEGE